MNNKQGHCEDCGGFETEPEGECNKCKGKLGTLIPGKDQKPAISKYRKKLNTLTKDDWRIVHEIGERIHRGFKGVAIKKGDVYFTMVNKKIVTLTGSYPYLVDQVYSFRSHETQIKYFKMILEISDE